MKPNKKRLRFYLGLGAFCTFLQCSTGPQSKTTTSNNAYYAFFSDLSEAQQKRSLKSLENFVKHSAFDEINKASLNFKKEDPIVLQLDPENLWFESLFTTLAGIQLMAQSHSFRGFKNTDCLDAYAKSSAQINSTATQELMSLIDFMKAGNRIPDDKTFTLQARAYCGRKAQVDLKSLNTQDLKKLSLVLKSNLVLQKKILTRAENESKLIQEAYRTALGNFEN